MEIYAIIGTEYHRVPNYGSIKTKALGLENNI